MAVSVDNKVVTGASIKKFKEYVDSRLEQAAPLTASDLQNGNVPYIKTGYVTTGSINEVDDTGELLICGGEGYGHGGLIALRGKNRKIGGVVQEDRGSVYLETRDSEGNYSNSAILTSNGFGLDKGKFFGTSTNSDNLGGLAPSDFCKTIEYNYLKGRVENHSWYFVKGQIGNASVTASRLLGSVSIHLMDGIARIDVVAWFDRQTEGANFSWGINSNLFPLLDSRIPYITPVTGGTLKYTTNDFPMDSSLEGFGGVWESRTPFWTPARIYNESGNVGSWPENAVPIGTRMIGVLYGTY